MAFDLLIIDPQNDFLDIAGAALPVPGADADMARLAQWLQQHTEVVESITVTLDSHASIGIERTTFWQQEGGGDVAPFTLITAADVQSGRFTPRHTRNTSEVIAYLQALESGARRQLVVWPVHCVLGTWGHNIHAALAESLAQWEQRSGLTCNKVLKGRNPLTEQYSAFRAEVPRADDASTALNQTLMDTLAEGTGTLLVAGEASSHCVASSVDDLMANLPEARLRQTVLLTDCMSPVTGFEEAAASMLQRAQTKGMRAFTLSALLA
jgi:nicotinamidase-related amidase